MTYNQIKLKSDLYSFFLTWQALMRLWNINAAGQPWRETNDENGSLAAARDACQKLLDELDSKLRGNPAAKGTLLEKGPLKDSLCQMNFHYRVVHSNAPFCATMVYDILFNPDYKPERKEAEENLADDGDFYSATVTLVRKAEFKQVARTPEEARERIEGLCRMGWFANSGDLKNGNEWSFAISNLKRLDAIEAKENDDD